MSQIKINKNGEWIPVAAQSDWSTTNKKDPSYIHNKPQYVAGKNIELNNQNGKISINAAQSDWAQDNPNGTGYIKNKPEIKNYTAGEGINIDGDLISLKYGTEDKDYYSDILEIRNVNLYTPMTVNLNNIDKFFNNNTKIFDINIEGTYIDPATIQKWSVPGIDYDLMYTVLVNTYDNRYSQFYDEQLPYEIIADTYAPTKKAIVFKCVGNKTEIITDVKIEFYNFEQGENINRISIYQNGENLFKINPSLISLGDGIDVQNNKLISTVGGKIEGERRIEPITLMFDRSGSQDGTVEFILSESETPINIYYFKDKLINDSILFDYNQNISKISTFNYNTGYNKYYNLWYLSEDSPLYEKIIEIYPDFQLGDTMYCALRGYEGDSDEMEFASNLRWPETQNSSSSLFVLNFTKKKNIIFSKSDNIKLNASLCTLFLNVPNYNVIGPNGLISEQSYTYTDKSNFIVGENCVNFGSFGTNYGECNMDIGRYNFTYGKNNINEGELSFIIGENNHTSGFRTTTIGENLKSSIINSLVVGSYNDYAKSYLFSVGNGNSSDRQNAFGVDSSGNAYCGSNGAFDSTTGADYAEYFEWKDGNQLNDDRRGFFVTLVDDKIKFADEGEYILGVITGNQAFIGNSGANEWSQKYLTDIYGAALWEQLITEEISDEDGNVLREGKIETVKKLNPDYNPDEKYIPRSERKEWAPVGLMGQLVVNDHGDCLPNSFCTAGEGGYAVPADSGYRVMKRLDDSHILVLIK